MEVETHIMVTDVRIPPYDQASEQAVLGSLLVDGECIHSIHGRIKTQDFFIAQNQWVYEACESITERGEGINQITVARELASRNRLEECGGAAYLSHLVANTPSSVLVKDYAQIVRNLAVQRKAISLGTQISEKGYNEPNPVKLVSEIGKEFLKLQASISMPQLVTPKEWAEYGIDRYSKMSEGKSIAISTGFDQLDFATGGVFPGEYWVVASVTGGGKTTIALQWANVLSVFGNVLLASTEMGKGDILDRRIATSIKRPLRDIRSGGYSETLYGEITSQLGVIAKSNIYYFGQAGSLEGGGGMTTDMILSMANYMASSYGLKIIIVDYLQNLSDAYGKSLYERATYISRKLQNMARSLDIPVICLCQLNRELFRRDDKRPRLSDLKDSSGIEQDSDVVLFLHRESAFADERELAEKDIRIEDAELLIAKQRQGDQFHLKIPLKWDSETKTYSEVERR